MAQRKKTKVIFSVTVALFFCSVWFGETSEKSLAVVCKFASLQQNIPLFSSIVQLITRVRSTVLKSCSLELFVGSTV